MIFFRSVSRFLVLLFAALLSGCLDALNRETEAVEIPLRPVYTFLVPQATNTVERSFSGLVESQASAGISFEVSGRVIQVIAKEGGSYKKGEVLAKIDPTEYQNQVRNAEAQLLQAQRARQRTSELLATGNASNANMESAIAQEQAAKSQATTAKKQLEDTVLLMPYDGMIGQVNVDTGQVAVQGNAVMTILGDGEMEFQVGVPGRLIEHFTPGRKAKIRLGDLKGELFNAEIITVAPQPSDNTTYPVTLRFSKEDKRIREGMDGESLFIIPNAGGSVLAIPASCVAKNAKLGEYVWSVTAGADGKTGTVNRTTVKTGEIREGGTIEILEGLSAGDVIVSRGVYRIEEGLEVLLSQNS
ncbi:MAG: efflux RND transporter periplasmic adaptor subunit [Verrucomicrobiota bacterium]